MLFLYAHPFFKSQKQPQAEALWTKLALMNIDAAMTIAMRLPIFANAAMGDPASKREAEKAVAEKMSALSETGTVAAQAAAQLWWDLVMSPLTQLHPAEATARAARRTIEPVSRRARANRRRLTDLSRS